MEPPSLDPYQSVCNPGKNKYDAGDGEAWSDARLQRQFTFRNRGCDVVSVDSSSGCWEYYLPLNRVVLSELVSPITVGVAETLEAVVDTDDPIEELDVTETAVLSAEADVDDEAIFSVADDVETVAAVVLASSCRGRGHATPAETMLKHTNKQRRVPHIRVDGATFIIANETM